MNWYLEVLKKYAVFNGRSRRQEYWMFTLFNIIASIIFSTLDSLLGTNIFALLYTLAVLLPGIGVSIRRLHDIGRSGWWLLLSFIPVIGAIVLIYWACQDSQPGTNEYGPNPKGVA
ncbi:DUF805 domain-containing protein [Neisseria dumasiana]|uniref:DUF805 domain-containing protein n=1 Tax=Neisseria dumasiana TaxID=1931275 RepID=UPI000A193EC9|nr:DUF805 domain-containing protein [Neisseria dumasiana]OSI15981.1 hypothetical protein BV914_05085 [Neisseria dumasiana]